MYYITNHNGQVIAASSDLLALLEVENIDALYKQIALDAIEFALEDDRITVKTPLDETHYSVEKETLSSILGEMTLVRLIAESQEESTLEEESILPLEKEKEEAPLPFDDEEALFDIKEEKKEEEEVGIAPEAEAEAEVETAKAEEDDLLNLILPSSAEETIGTIAQEKGAAKAPVYIDVEQISQSIGISPEDYNTFLTEYIDTALSLEEDLRSNDPGKRTAATHTLFHLSNVLRLPVITEIIEQLKYTEEEDIDSSIESFYDTLSRLTTTKPETAKGEETKLSVEREAGGAAENFESFGTIDLSDVKPIHFDFQVSEAAEELSLPAELIEEFIQDFIKQAHEETDKMLKAYEKGDLETIQKIGHLLKGTASNLRINPLSDTLYEIQFCDDPSKLEALIKEYWAHFISFETQFNLKSQH
ncbi:Hpt domain-containing protein [Sulfurovum riftiae]|uniref:HPt domain-containing protein n=1 Tax=Sulfurovum riftiae TaxID=1630136 RepID=A0A151CFK1_9BACT|nr:Hpt domain-containing protein [Sulfurovum riftiae]KYJ86277.1 hypothetical protein AS592_05630 [Sulfurovum riftiae]